jgi:hypothetical protein
MHRLGHLFELVASVCTRDALGATSLVPPADTGLLTRIVEDAAGEGLIVVDERSARLTPLGRRVVVGIARHHLPPRDAVTGAVDPVQWANDDADQRCWEHRIVAAVEAELIRLTDRHLAVGTSCPALGGTPSSSPAPVRLDAVPPGTIGHIETIEPAPARALRDQLADRGIVAGLTVTVHDRRRDGTVIVQTWRGLTEVAPDIARMVRLVPGDLAAITDETTNRTRR